MCKSLYTHQWRFILGLFGHAPNVWTNKTIVMGGKGEIWDDSLSGSVKSPVVRHDMSSLWNHKYATGILVLHSLTCMHNLHYHYYAHESRTSSKLHRINCNEGLVSYSESESNADMVTNWVLNGTRPTVDENLATGVYTEVVALMKTCWSQAQKERPDFQSMKSGLTCHVFENCLHVTSRVGLARQTGPGNLVWPAHIIKQKHHFSQ